MIMLINLFGQNILIRLIIVVRVIPNFIFPSVTISISIDLLAIFQLVTIILIALSLVIIRVALNLALLTFSCYIKFVIIGLSLLIDFVIKYVQIINCFKHFIIIRYSIVMHAHLILKFVN